MAALQSHTTSNAATLVAARRARRAVRRRGGGRDIDAMVAEFKRRRDAALALLRAARSRRHRARGRVLSVHSRRRRVGERSRARNDASLTGCSRSLDVAVVPGVAFRTPEWIRVSYAAPAEQVLEGVRRIIRRAYILAMRAERSWQSTMIHRARDLWLPRNEARRHDSAFESRETVS